MFAGAINSLVGSLRLDACVARPLDKAALSVIGNSNHGSFSASEMPSSQAGEFDSFSIAE